MLGQYVDFQPFNTLSAFVALGLYSRIYYKTHQQYLIIEKSCAISHAHDHPQVYTFLSSMVTSTTTCSVILLL
jgi:hypothetical protein